VEAWEAEVNLSLNRARFKLLDWYCQIIIATAKAIREDWLSAENDIYDELFADELTTQIILLQS
jgi:hypothetical protein